MINLGNGWKSYLDCLRLEGDSYLHHKDENIKTSFVNLDGGADDNQRYDFRGLDLTDVESENVRDVTLKGLATGGIHLNGASLAVENSVDFGNARMEGCHDDNGIYFYDGGTADTQTFMGDVQADSRDKPTGTLLNSLLPFISEGSFNGCNVYVANSKSRAIKATTVDLALKPTDYPLNNYIKWTHARGGYAYTLTMFTYFKGVCNFYDFDGLRFEQNTVGTPLAPLSRGFTKDGVLTIHGSVRNGLAGWIPFLAISKKPNIITVKTYTII